MLAALLLLLLAQDVPAGEPEAEEVVVTATIGYTTMLFDKGADGALRNCRVMVSSGSDRRDTAACQAVPVCYARPAGQEAAGACVDMVVVDTRPTIAAQRPIYDVPKLVQPQAPRPASALGPIGLEERTRESEAQRVKLPPLPQAPKDRPVVTFGAGNRKAEEPR